MSKPRDRSNRTSFTIPDLVGAGVTRSRGFNCHACGVWFGVFQNATGLNAGQNAISMQTFALECPTCAHADEYTTDEIVELNPPERPGHDA